MLNFIYKIISIVKDALENVNKLIMEKTIVQKYIGNIMANIGLFAYKHFYQKSTRNFVIILLQVLPRTIVCLALFIDVFISHKFNYVYKTSIFLILPLIEKYITYNLEIFCNANIILLDEVLALYDKNTLYKMDITKIINILFFDKSEILRKTIIVRLSPDFCNSFDKNKFNYKATLKKYESFFADMIFPIKSFLYIYNASKSNLLTYFNIILSFVYIIIWTQVLINSW